MVAPDKLVDSSMDKAETKGETDNQAASVPNGNEIGPPDDQLEKKRVEEGGRQPSYVSLACCISGYSTLSYDSKQRQGICSLSPSKLTRPLTSLTNGNQNALYKSECGNYLSPQHKELNPNLTMDGKGVEVLNGCQSLSSPRHMSRMSITSESRRNFTSSMISESYTYSTSTSHFTSYSNSSPVSSTSSPRSHIVKTDYVNGSRLIQATKAPTQISPSSFIVQRVERLYGPGALAQGFYSPRRLNTPKEKDNSTPTRGDKLTESGEKKVDDSLPVLKLLRPEFRAQLTVKTRKSKSPESARIDSDTANGEPLRNDTPTSIDDIDATVLNSKTEFSTGEVKDGNYFIKLLDEKVVALEEIACKADKDLENCGNEEGAGMYRALSGKARLLVAEKLNQFRGLCHKNLKQTEKEDFPTTNEDLAGFWDMVLIQVNDVLSQSEEIEEMKNNDWKQLTPKPKTDSTSRGASGTRKLQPRKINSEPKVSAASKARDEARRKMIEERRKAMKELKKEADTDVILV